MFLILDKQKGKTSTQISVGGIEQAKNEVDKA